MTRLKKYVVFVFICFMIISTLTARVDAAKRTDRQLINTYCRTHYPGYKIKIIKEFDNRIMHRKGKHIVYVEKTITYSNGQKGGYDKYGYYSAYNKKVPKGKRVAVYCIWNPYNNYEDDIVAVVDNKMIR